MWTCTVFEFPLRTTVKAFDLSLHHNARHTQCIRWRKKKDLNDPRATKASYDVIYLVPPLSVIMAAITGVDFADENEDVITAVLFNSNIWICQHRDVVNERDHCCFLLMLTDKKVSFNMCHLWAGI